MPIFTVGLSLEFTKDVKAKNENAAIAFAKRLCLSAIEKDCKLVLRRTSDVLMTEYTVKSEADWKRIKREAARILRNWPKGSPKPRLVPVETLEEELWQNKD